MSGYITGFSVYTLAMIGVIFIALAITKKSLSFGNQKNKDQFLKIENCLTIEPRKSLYVVKAGDERFLVTSSPEGCQFMTKLEDKNCHPELADCSQRVSKVNSFNASNQAVSGSGKSKEIPNQSGKHPEIEMPVVDYPQTYSKKYIAGIF